MKHIGRDLQRGRDMYMAVVSSAEDVPADFRLPTKYFLAMIVWDSATSSVDSISRLVEALLRSGCVYIDCWGSGCERMHDISDELIVLFQVGLMDTRPTDAQDLSATGDEGRLIMTTWHAKETLDEALHFYLTDTHSGEEYESQCGCAVVLVIDQPAPVIDRIHRALLDPEAFRAEVDGVDGNDTGDA